MEKSTKVLIGIATVMLIYVFAIAPAKEKSQTPITGSVNQSNEYHATSTYAGIQNYSVLKSGAGALGSVVLTASNAGTINLYDATSTVTNTAWPTTTLAKFPASVAAGTYTFDVIFQKGLLIEATGIGFATATITYR